WARHAHGRHLRVAGCAAKLDLYRQRLGQPELPARDHVDPRWVAQSGDLQPQFRIERRRLRLFPLEVLQLKTQLDAPEALVAPEQEKRSEEHTSELQSRFDLVCRLLLEKKNKIIYA